MSHKYHHEKPLKIIFAGTMDFSAHYLNLLLLSHHTVSVILTKKKTKNNISPIQILSNNYNIPILTPKSLKKKKILKKIRKIISNIIIVIAYGIIIPKDILNIFPKQFINIHTSLLPQLRGAAPIQWSILNGDHKTGITIIQMDKQIDTGKILYQKPYNIKKNETITSLTKKLSNIGIQKILNIINNIHNKKYIPQEQNHKHTTYAIKTTKKMAEINFFISAKNIEKMIRSLNPNPGTYITIKNKNIKILEVKILKNKKKYQIGEIIKINNKGIQIQTIKNIINITKIQIPGKKIIQVSEFINSHQKIFFKKKILNNKK
ncbi:methionyl-tRNA formyltransferase [Buchnera aphidicola]|uniref:Methionyl-tRNA formyltransferase n=1 Tax=Buchnera aphidicola (Stegophylla sp.) TaxID=2315800 RepID=A0A4D6YJ43_9GAMM|nr:methionyl-tRNA formyltransferase [Buchnera aphidicola (Stegophylla sp.)]QCI26461.1 methionyl-tRNA formyltransferase [Buchnera aphidicola (Stegophylla sp.)]